MLQRSELPALVTGFAATLSGLGLARFAFTALMPQMVQAGWYNGEQMAYLGGANLLGYLIGALAAAPLAERLGAQRVLGCCWLAVGLSLLGCSGPQPQAWFFGWRLLSGVAGAMLMVLGPSVAMSAVPAQRRAVLGPLTFCGVGAGALLSAVVVPALAPLGLRASWWGLAALALACGLWGWHAARRLPQPSPLPQPFQPALAVAQNAAMPAPARVVERTVLWSAPVLLLMLAYPTDSFGFVPHTVFWVDYLARELQRDTAYVASQWAFFGVGAIVGPLAAAFCASRWGWWGTATGAYALKAAAIAMPLWASTFAAHAISGFLVGALSPGIASITSAYLMHLIGPLQHKRMWGYATAGFALMQVLSGYLMAWIYATTGHYRPLFLIGSLSLATGTLLVAATRLQRTTVPRT